MSARAWIVRSFVLAMVATGVDGCSNDDGPTNTGSALGDDWNAQCATDRNEFVYQHAVGSNTDPRTTGLYADSIDSTVASRRIITGSSNGFDWIPGTDSLIVIGGGTFFQISSATGSGFQIRDGDEAANPRVSPSRRYVAYIGGAGGRSCVFVLDRFSSAVVNITPDSMEYRSCDWSPDGEELAVMGRSPTRNGLFRIQRDGAVVKFLAPGVSGDGIPAWAPDGVRIAWRATGHVAMVDTSGVPLEPLPLISGIDVSWTATGDGIVYSSPTLVGDRVFLYHLNTHRITQLTE